MAVKQTIHARSPPSGCTGVSLPAESHAVCGSPVSLPAALPAWLLSCPLSCTTAVSISVTASVPALSVVSSIYCILSFVGATDRLLTVPPEADTSQWYLRRSRVWSVQFSSVQDCIYVLGKARMRTTPSSEVSPMSPLKRFQCSSDWRWPFLVLSRKIV